MERPHVRARRRIRVSLMEGLIRGRDEHRESEQDDPIASSSTLICLDARMGTPAYSDALVRFSSVASPASGFWKPFSPFFRPAADRDIGLLIALRVCVAWYRAYIRPIPARTRPRDKFTSRRPVHSGSVTATVERRIVESSK